MAIDPDVLEPALNAQFLVIRRAFVGGLANRQTEIQEAASREDLAASLHRLVGAAGAFGFDELSRLARDTLACLQLNDQEKLQKHLDSLGVSIQAIRGVS